MLKSFLIMVLDWSWSTASLESPVTTLATRSQIMIKHLRDKLENSSDQMQVQTVGLGWHQMDANNHCLGINSNKITSINIFHQNNVLGKYLTPLCTSSTVMQY